MILADIDYQEQYSPSKWSTRMSADEIVPAHVEQVSFQRVKSKGNGRTEPKWTVYFEPQDRPL